MPFVVLTEKQKELVFAESERLDRLILEKYNERFSNDDLVKDLELKKEIEEISNLKAKVINSSLLIGMSICDWKNFESKGTL